MDREQCTVEGCPKPQKANGLCNGHNERRRLGKPLEGPLQRYALQDPVLAEAGLRACNMCNVVKPIEDFYINQWYCRVCSTAQATAYKKAHPEWNREQAKLYRDRYPEKKQEQTKAWRSHNPEYRRKYTLKTVYNLTPEQVEKMLAEQGSVCAVCGTDKPGGPRTAKTWTVDHDHETGRVRGLLCTRCNRALGLLRDDPMVLRAAIAYLEKGIRHGGSDER